MARDQRNRTRAAMTARKKLGFALVAVLGFFILFEIASCLVEWARSQHRQPEVETAVRDRFHPLRFELVPGADLPVNGAIAHINAAGLRGADPEVPNRRTRVLCLGDSCTFGYAPDVTDDATYPAVLERLLGPDQYEVLNGGMPGFGSLDCLNFWVQRGQEFEPDRVVILAGWNDYANAHPLVKWPPPAKPLAVLDHLAIFRLEKRLIAKFVRPPALDLTRERVRLERSPTPQDDRLSERAFARTQRTLAEIVQSCRRHDARPILVNYATFSRPEWTNIGSLTDAELRLALPYLATGELSPKGWRAYTTRTNEMIRHVAEAEHVPLVETDTIDRTDDFADLIHLSKSGCAALAARVAKVISSDRKE